MNLHINGEARDFPAQSSFTLASLIESLGMKSDRVAVELNREIAPRDRWPQIELKDGDRLEIVHFVGGGAPSISPPTHHCHSERSGERTRARVEESL
jgi:thiamine biosynthesis protein ThiS